MTPANSIRRELTQLRWVWQSLTPLERAWWAHFATTTQDESWHLHNLFFACLENEYEKSSAG